MKVRFVKYLNSLDVKNFTIIILLLLLNFKEMWFQFLLRDHLNLLPIWLLKNNTMTLVSEMLFNKFIQVMEVFLDLQLLFMLYSLFHTLSRNFSFLFSLNKSLNILTYLLAFSRFALSLFLVLIITQIFFRFHIFALHHREIHFFALWWF